MFGPDGYLYASTGDASRAGQAQELDDLGGKILRMTTDGRPAPGNPFPHSLIWSYGHRNPQGIAWDTAGTMYVSEIGEAVWDELNIIVPGGNYGWPEVEGIGNHPDYIDPIAAWRPEVGVTSGVALLGRTAVVTCLRGQRIYLVDLQAGAKTSSFVAPRASGAPARRASGGGRVGAWPAGRWRPWPASTDASVRRSTHRMEASGSPPPTGTGATSQFRRTTAS